MQCRKTAAKPSDNIDNDCDGKIDEERINGKDDDDDGLIDEDFIKVRLKSSYLFYGTGWFFSSANEDEVLIQYSMFYT